MITYHKKQYIDESNLQINALSSGFQYGIGFFTTLKFKNNTFYYLNEHITRLQNSCKDFQIELEDIDIVNVLKKLMELNNQTEARIKILIYLDTDNIGKYVIIPQQLVITNSPKTLLAKLSIRKTNPLYRYKSLNYFENIYQKSMLADKKNLDFLFFNDDGLVLEATSSNIFFIEDNKIVTPTLNLPILGGIIRNRIIDLEEFEVIEKNISINEIGKYIDCFLTNSIQGIIQIKGIEMGNELVNYSINCPIVDKLLKIIER